MLDRFFGKIQLPCHFKDRLFFAVEQLDRPATRVPALFLVFAGLSRDAASGVGKGLAIVEDVSGSKVMRADPVAETSSGFPINQGEPVSGGRGV